MRNIVIGMAGHIDHGKTTVVRCLTGVDTDTLPEEKARGMTINLGFTQLKFPDGSGVGVVDVPGHEKFIKNMSAGVSGVDYVILVIACDDGIMPQTEEHFQIIQLFGVKKGMILLTKRDLVSDERFEEVRLQCQNYFKGSFLEGARILPVSSGDIKSFETVKTLLWEEIKSFEVKKDKKFFRLDIDRAFSIKGFGSVVTGTVRSGEVAVDELLTLYPLDRKVRVKGIETHGEKKERVNAGNRCAINLSGIELEELRRGEILATSLLTGERIDCRLTLLSTSPKIKNNHRVRLNIGTIEVIGRVRMYDRNFILGGESAIVQLQLEKRIGGALGDRGIVRNYSPITTIGGIELLYFLKEEFNRKDSSHLDFLSSLIDKETIERAEILFKKGLTQSEINSFLGEEIDIEQLFKNSKLYTLDKKIFHIENLFLKLTEIEKYLMVYQSNNPLHRGILKLEMKNIFFLNFSQKEFNEFLNLDFVRKRLQIVGEYVSTSGYKIKLTKEEKNMKEEIFSHYKAQKFELKPYSEYLLKSSDKELFERVHRYMVEEEFLVYLEEDRYILSGYLKESIKIFKSFFESRAELSVKEARELLNNKRDSAILILRKLDALKITENIDGIRRRREE